MSSSKLANFAVLTTDLKAFAVALAISSGPDIVSLFNLSASEVRILILARSLMTGSRGTAIVMALLFETVEPDEEKEEGEGGIYCRKKKETDGFFLGEKVRRPTRREDVHKPSQEEKKREKQEELSLV